MSKVVFVSYCHKQGDWVWDRLVPCLRASGADVRIDRERFVAGKAVVRQMDAEQDKAEISILILSPEYLTCPYCVHEMNRAFDRDPKFKSGSVVPVKRVNCTIPPKIKIPNPLYVDLRNDKDTSQWDLLLKACGADLGAAAPDWLSARDTVVQLLKRNQPVNLVVSGYPKWRELIKNIHYNAFPDLKIVDLESGATASRRGLVTEILNVFVDSTNIPPEPEDLVVLNHLLSNREMSRLALVHFDLVRYRQQYSADLFSTLRYLLMEARKLVLLIQSRTPFAALLGKNHPLSSIDIQTVELKGRK